MGGLNNYFFPYSKRKKVVISLVLAHKGTFKNIVFQSALIKEIRKNSFMKKTFILTASLVLLWVAAWPQGKNATLKVTFIELGSVNCIPCKMMQPVMKKVREKYGAQVKVVFYDVWTDRDSKYAQQYKIRAIPTQVFLDANGKEYSRHEGYFPFEELEKVLKRKGVQ
jgi:thioredoxin 1